MSAVTICSDFGFQENKICHCFHFSLSICHKVTGPDAMIFDFGCFSEPFHSPLSPLSRGSWIPLHFLPLKWYRLHIWGCWYFSQQSWFQLVSHPAQHFMMHSAYKLNKQGGLVFPSLRNFSQFVVIHTVKGFSVVNEAEIDAFLESLAFCDPMDISNLISGSSAFSKSSLFIWKFSVHILLKPSLKDFERYFASMWNECNCTVVWTFFGIALLWARNENWSHGL